MASVTVRAFVERCAADGTGDTTRTQVGVVAVTVLPALRGVLGFADVYTFAGP